MIILVMGVAGSGKTTVGRLLAQALRWPCYDADAYHAPQSVTKMARGIPLDDADRTPWLATLHALLLQVAGEEQSAVLACSALKAAYRRQLAEGVDLRVIYLRATPELIRRRFATRTGHFMPAALIASQFATLEEPDDALVLNAACPPEALVVAVLQCYFAS